MTIGIIGLGSMGEGRAINIQNLYPDAEISILTKREVWNGEGSRTTLVQDEAEFFAQPHEVYFITNETHKHAATLSRCLTTSPRGVFIEKPLSHTSDDLSAIIAQVKASSIVCVVGYSLQFFPPLLELKRIIERGEIGEVVSMRVSVGKDVHSTRPPEAAARYSSSAHTGGGVILDYIHELNYPAWLLGEELSFVMGAYGTVRLPIDAEDIAESIFKTKSGVVVSIHQDYLQLPGKRLCEVQGTRGTATFSRVLRRGSLENEIAIDSEEESQTILIEASGSDMYTAELEAFMAHVAADDGYTNLDEAVRDVENAEVFKEKGIQLTGRGAAAT